MALIKCPECGKEISDKANQCPNCGCPASEWKSAVPVQASAPKNAENSAPKKICPACGRQNFITARFCEICGASLMSQNEATPRSQSVSQGQTSPAARQKEAATPDHKACPKCGMLNSYDTRICWNCHRDFSTGAIVESQRMGNTSQADSDTSFFKEPDLLFFWVGVGFSYILEWVGFLCRNFKMGALWAAVCVVLILVMSSVYKKNHGFAPKRRWAFWLLLFIPMLFFRAPEKITTSTEPNMAVVENTLESANEDATLESTEETVEMQSDAEETSLEEILAQFEADGYVTVSMDADVLYQYGAYYTGWAAHTAFVVDDESQGDTLKCRTESNDTSFFSLVCYLDEEIDITEGDTVELIGVVEEPSFIGSTVSLKHCKVVSKGDKAQAAIDELKTGSEQQIADAEAVKTALEEAALEAAIQDKEEYRNSCEKVSYSDVERNPDNFNGKNIVITGKVIQVAEGWFDSVTLRVEASGGDVWYVTYVHEEGESRILEDDKVTIYGECTGVTTYTSVLGTAVSIPSCKAKVIDIQQ